MPRRRSRSVQPFDLPPMFQHVIRAAGSECPSGHADALAELGALALVKVPARGVLDPGVHGEHELFSAIDAIARRHLDFTSAQHAWRAAVDAAGLSLPLRDEIEQAASHVQNISDTAYFYAGLAFGLAFVTVTRRD